MASSVQDAVEDNVIPDDMLERSAKNPQKTATILSKFFFCWLDPLVWLGYRQELKQEDLYSTPDETKSQHLWNKFNKYWISELQRSSSGQKARLWLALFKCFRWTLLVHGILFFILLSPPILLAVLVGYLSQYFCEKSSLEGELTLLKAINNSDLVGSKEEEIRTATRDAYLYATGITLLIFWSTSVYSLVFYYGQKVGMMFRIVMIGAIYSKVVKLSQSTIGKLSIGHIVNLASNDVQRFDMALEFVHVLWTAPLFIILTTYLLWREIGPSCLTALAVILLQTPIQCASSILFARWRLKSARVTDKRVRVMNEIISGMRLIKMYAWEWAFHEYVKKIRRKESRIITQGGLIYGINFTTFYLSLSVLNFVTFSTYTGLGNVLTPKKVFSSFVLFASMARYFVLFLVYCILRLSELIVAYRRVEKLLTLPELGLPNITNSVPVKRANNNYKGVPHLVLVNEELYSGGCKSYSVDTPKIVVHRLTASWTNNSDKLTLQDISFTMDKFNRLLAVVGPVGSGKSSLLQCLLRELEPLGGSVHIEGTVSYASQEPWIFSGTVKENILFGQDFDKAWFNRVVECCSLFKDINEMPFGEETLIGERGVNLSGGQKARISLARAVYRVSDIILLDDPLSAVDTAVGRHLFDRCICGVLANRLVVLVTHQLQYAQHADSILVLKEGLLRGFGKYEELTLSGLDPTELFDDIDDKTPDVVCNGSSVQPKVAPERIRDLVGDPSIPAVLGETLLHAAPSLHSLVSTHDDDITQTDMKNVVPEEERAHGTISNKTYFHYVREGGNTVLVFLLVMIFVLSEGSTFTSNWWLSAWASEDGSCSLDISNATLQHSSDFDLNTNQRIGIYAGITTALILITMSKAVFSYIICLNASSNLHNKMFKAILRAPVLFFDTNPVGRVLNRFSTDVGIMDIVLPHFFLHFFTLFLKIIAVVVVACVANYWIVIPSVIITVILLAFRHYFLHASRNIQRLEALARSPLYSHISATIQGLVIIRAYGKQSKFINKLHFYVNEHSKGWYAKISSFRWFGARLDLIAACFITIVIYTSIILVDSLNPALAGLSIVYAVSLVGTLQFGIKTSTELENMLVSVERVMAYGKLKSEGELINASSETLPIGWPENGTIVFDDAKFKYASNFPYALKSVSFRIGSGEKVGIVGRTGAGKSSLLAALFRLAEPEGLLEIDGIQVTDIGLHDLRTKISIIPQDPVLFSGTVRYNVDPFDKYKDCQLWDALEQVQLKNVVLGLKGGLEAEVSEGGTNFSVGQRQLICLARALLRENKILVIDEATANVDFVTDGIIQEMIRSKFSHCTILTIAHRLETIMDSDRILVLSSGKVIEFDTPFKLLQKQQSVFCSMVEKTGPTESRRLKEIAVHVELLKSRTKEQIYL